MLGHLVFSRGIEVDKAKIDVITSLPYPVFCVGSVFFSWTGRFLQEICLGF